MDKNCWESSPSLHRQKKYKSTKLTADVYFGNLLISLHLDKDGLSWEENGTTNNIKYQHITNVKRSKTNPGICVNYLAKSSDSFLQLRQFKITFNSSDISESWSKSISKKIKKSFKRIKSLIFFIDNIVDRCNVNGNTLFKEYMKGVMHEVKVTYVIKEIKSLEDIDDLEPFIALIKSSDGIVILGGDETACAIISNIVNLFQTDDYFVKHVPVPFTIIPIGNHNDISRSIWGTQNIQNIFLNIFLCNTFQVDVLSVTKDKNHKKAWGFNCHYGYYSIFEKYRLSNCDMKQSLLTKKVFKKLRSFDCAIQYKSPTHSTGDPLDDTVCHKNCSFCNLKTMSVSNTHIVTLNSSAQSVSKDFNNYETIKDSFGISWIIINCIPCRNELTFNAFTPYCHFNDGSADMVLVKSANINDIKKYLKYQTIEGTHLKLPFVDSKRIEEIHINIKSYLSWNQDDPKVGLESILSKECNNDMVIIEDTSSSSDQEEVKDPNNVENSKSTAKDENLKTNKKKISKLLRPMMKACKELTKATPSSQGNDNYRKPNMLESDKERERKAEKQKKRDSELRKFEPSWMLDYNFLFDTNGTIDIKVHSGVVTFFGEGMD